MVDGIRGARLLRSVTNDVAFLDWEAGAEPPRRADVMWRRGVKYTFVTAIEGCVDVTQHLCATQGWGPIAVDDKVVAARLKDRPACQSRQGGGDGSGEIADAVRA